MPTDLMIFSPPTLVPRPMTVLHRSMSHTGIRMPSTLLWPLAKAIPRKRNADELLPVLGAVP